MESRFVIVSYDIPDTKVRNRLIHSLFTFGLSRVQFSVFSGVIPASRITLMQRQIQSDFSGKENKILIVPLCSSCVKNLSGVNVVLTPEPLTHIVI